MTVTVAATTIPKFTIPAPLASSCAVCIDEFRARHPEVMLELESHSLSDPSCGLLSGETDVAFVRLPIDVPELS